ncbi:long-chain fatty acid--CoA ligase [Reichenbachiella agarivorans]|uniref:Long-chain fatty acid--CoA ligase n=1 Tax=Reichenbachiella agarivorans TaxID=2979464 RepID=A0ABY6CRP1_9BACT|nr:long-chain fatty acid--CoA ligase [Reichenbachiella agarivorans]UXP33166.1 long-chain fatty acid--CoA ligase [Reichenbachiella agarivorans]
MKTPTRVFDFLYYQRDMTPQSVCLAHKQNGSWKKYSTQDVLDIVAKLGLGLIKLGVEPGDKVAIISSNRPEWNFVDQACAEIGAVSVPMYPTITADDFKYIFEHAGVKVIFASSSELISKAQLASQDLSIEHLYSFDDVEGAANWKQILSLDPEGDLHVMAQRKAAIVPNDLFTIIYTSGTTGRPKGVMLSHENVVSNALAVKSALKDLLDAGSKALSFLPLCHILERTASFFYFYSGISVYYAESMDTIGENLKEVRPQMFTTVPRLLEKIYDKIISKGYELSWAKRKLFFWAVDLGLQFEPFTDQGLWYNLQLTLARKLVFSKWKEALGNDLSYILVGAAALQPRLARVFWAAEIPVCEGYGLTETSPGIAFNVPYEGGVKVGSVGKVLDRIEVKIAEDGEILCKGPNVMLGYYRSPEQTADVMVEGWFHTGDIGVLEDGFLRITDRKKEMFKTSGGKYIAPQQMENRFKESPYIEQIMILGEGQKFPSALIVPNKEALEEWSKSQNIIDTNPEILYRHPKVLELYQAEINRFNEDFGNWEQVKRFEIVESVWGIDTGELTPTLKLKRRVIRDKFANLIERIYGLSS